MSTVIYQSGRRHRLDRKSASEIRGRLRCRLERQGSLDANAESAIVSRLIRQTSLSSSSATANANEFNANDTNLSHSSNNNSLLLDRHISMNGSNNTTLSHSITDKQHTEKLRLCTTTAIAMGTETENGVLGTEGRTTFSMTDSNASTTNVLKNNGRLQRHRSSETPEERLKNTQCYGKGIYLPLPKLDHQQRHQPQQQQLQPLYYRNHYRTHRRAGSSGNPRLVSMSGGSLDVNDLELDIGVVGTSVSTQDKIGERGETITGGPLQSWTLGTFFAVFLSFLLLI